MADYYNIIQNHLTAFKQGMFTSLPAQVIEYDPSLLTVDVEVLTPSIFGGVQAPQTKLLRVPVMFPSAGGGMISFPIEAGDTVMLLFSMRDMTNWKAGDGGLQPTNSKRTHDRNDAVAIVGLFANEQARPTPTTDSVKIQYKDSSVTLEETKVIIDTSSTVELGSGVIESAVLGESLKTYIDGHQHGIVDTVSGAPTIKLTSKPATNVIGTPPVTPPASVEAALFEDPLPSSVLSTKVKVE